MPLHRAVIGGPVLLPHSIEVQPRTVPQLEESPGRFGLLASFDPERDAAPGLALGEPVCNRPKALCSPSPTAVPKGPPCLVPQILRVQSAGVTAFRLEPPKVDIPLRARGRDEGGQEGREGSHGEEHGVRE